MSVATRYIGKTVKLDGKDYVIVKANNHDENFVSLRSVITGLFLRHKMGRVVETDADDNQAVFPADSSFFPEEREKGIVLHCSNPGMEDNYICKIDIDTFIVNTDLTEYVFQVTDAPVPSVERELGLSSTENVSGNGFLGLNLSIDSRTYMIVPANDGDSAHISLLNMKNGLYARHFDSKIVESNSDMNADFFPADSSFKPETRENGLILRCVNKGMENLAIVKGKGAPVTTLIGDVGSAQVFHAAGMGGMWEILKTMAANVARMTTLLEATVRTTQVSPIDKSKNK